jgi:nitrate reductase molybdenum cofactor assembly chaperone NarJ/NarW
VIVYERFAALLEYPTSPVAALSATAIAECEGRCPQAAAQLAAFAAEAGPRPLADLQELYARTFDFDADTALYVGHHLFGEEGRRGLLIAGLVDRYRRLEMEIGVELADHMSPVLRSLARDEDSEEARELVRMALRPALAKILPSVERRANPYAAVVRALASAIDEQTGEPFDPGSDRCRSSSSPFFLTLLS